MALYTLLVVARRQNLATRLEGALGAGQYGIQRATSASQAVSLELSPDLVVVDAPPSGGVRTTARLKERFPVPVLALQASGRPPLPQASATLVHPVDVAQLAQLIEATLRQGEPGIVRAGDMLLDTTTRQLQANGSLHQLPPIGCQILAVLMGRPGEVVYRDELFRHVWQTDHQDSSRALDVHIASLRRLLERDPRRPSLIVTERGLGYRFNPPATIQ